MKHLEIVKIQNKGLFYQAEVFGRKIMREKLNKPEKAVNILMDLFEDFMTKEPDMH